MNRGKHDINNIWTDSLINCTCPSPNVSSNCLFYDWRYPSHLVNCCFLHTLSLSLSLRCLAIFPILIVWYKNPGIHFQVIIDRNKLFQYTSLFHIEVAYNNIYNKFDTMPASYIFSSEFYFVCLFCAAIYRLKWNNML